MVGEKQRYDRICSFQDARYVYASEALWSLFHFELIDEQLIAVRLDVHLENHHIVFSLEQQQQQAVSRSRPCTKLTEWFAASRKWPGASIIKYCDYPVYFTS